MKELLLLMSVFTANVKDFGAVGDGISDDTAAIANAAADCRAKLKAIQPPGGSYMGSCPDLFFPAGKYLISAGVSLNPYQTVRGEDAIIVQSDPQSSIFLCHGGYQNRFVGMQFVGGSKQVVFSNANIDSSFLTFRDCAFQGWSSWALWAEGTVDDLHLSTTFKVERCRFDGGQAIYTHCDTTQVSDCEVHFRGASIPNGGSWIKNAGFQRANGVYSYGGTLGLTNITFVPAAPVVPAEDGSAPKTVKAYWIDNAGTVVSERVRFSGEGAGVPILIHRAPVNLRNPWKGSKVVFNACQLSCGQDADPTAAVVTLSGGWPQCMRFTANDGLVSNKIPLVKVADGYDLATDIKKIKASAAPSVQMYSVTIQGNQIISAPMPTLLSPFVK